MVLFRIIFTNRVFVASLQNGYISKTNNIQKSELTNHKRINLDDNVGIYKIQN